VAIYKTNRTMKQRTVTCLLFLVLCVAGIESLNAQQNNEKINKLLLTGGLVSAGWNGDRTAQQTH
jgi:hypothetical protein